jgi:hypothetical protein
MYKIHQRYELDQKFRKIFNISFRGFLDAKLTVIYNGALKIDYAKFEEYLKVPDNTSMEKFILTNYGTEGVKLIKQLL